MSIAETKPENLRMQITDVKSLRAYLQNHREGSLESGNIKHAFLESQADPSRPSRNGLYLMQYSNDISLSLLQKIADEILKVEVREHLKEFTRIDFTYDKKNIVMVKNGSFDYVNIEGQLEEQGGINSINIVDLGDVRVIYLPDPQRYSEAHDYSVYIMR